MYELHNYRCLNEQFEISGGKKKEKEKKKKHPLTLKFLIFVFQHKVEYKNRKHLNFSKVCRLVFTQLSSNRKDVTQKSIFKQSTAGLNFKFFFLDWLPYQGKELSLS